MSQPPAPTHTLPARDRARIRKILTEQGERRTVALLHISRQTLPRLLCEMSVHAGTIALVRQRLTEIDKESGDRVPAGEPPYIDRKTVESAIRYGLKRPAWLREIMREKKRGK